MPKFYRNKYNSLILTQNCNNSDELIPITNDIYNIIIQEAMDLLLDVTYYYDDYDDADEPSDRPIYIRIVSGETTIRCYDKVMTVQRLGTIEMEIDYVQYTNLQALIND